MKMLFADIHFMRSLFYKKSNLMGECLSYTKYNKLIASFRPKEKRGPIGTNYERVIPAKEINSKDRDSFWKKEEEEERRRVDMEKERTQQLRAKEEREIQLREEKECQEREQRTATPQAVATIAKSPTKTGPKLLVNKITVGEVTSPSSSNTQVDEIRKARNNEAKELIGSRVGTAKAIFSQNSASGQMFQKNNAPAKPVRNSIAQRINSLNNPTLMTPGGDDEVLSREKPPRRMVAVAAAAGSEPTRVIETIVEQKTFNATVLENPNSEVDIHQSKKDDVVIFYFYIIHQ